MFSVYLSNTPLPEPWQRCTAIKKYAVSSTCYLAHAGAHQAELARLLNVTRYLLLSRPCASGDITSQAAGRGPAAHACTRRWAPQ